MFWLQTGVLSDKKILGLLGKKIYIWPFNVNNVKGSTYNLTASPVAWSLKNSKLLLNDKNEIEIPAGDTALIQTDESIYVEKDICGSYHSKVKLVSRGLGHIGTTLDPYFFGTSLIAVHNHTEKNQKIAVGETFVSLMLHKMPNSTRILHDNQPFRSDIRALQFTTEDFLNIKNKEKKELVLKEIQSWCNEQWRQNRDCLIETVQNHTNEITRKKRIPFVRLFFNIIAPAIIIVAIITGIITTYLSKDYASVWTVISGAAVPVCSKLGEFIENYIKGDA